MHRDHQSRIEQLKTTTLQMARTINILLVLSICFTQLGCDHGAGLQPQAKEATVSSPVTQHENQANSKPLSGQEHWIRGNLLRDETRYEEAAEEYQLAIDKGYDSNLVRTELGIVLDHYLHPPEAAITHFRVAGNWSCSASVDGSAFRALRNP